MKIYCDNIGMEFSIEWCTMLIMKSRKQQMLEGVELPNQGKSEYLKKRKLTNT